MVEHARQTKYGLPRATYLLLLLNSASKKGIEGRTRLEKLVFLMQKRLIEDLKWGITSNTYKFRAYNYGPFSEEVLDDLTSLQMLKLVEVEGEEQENQKFVITDKGREVVDKLVRNANVSHNLANAIKHIMSSFGELPLDKLVERVYKEYPDYTVNSLIRSRYL